MTRDQPTDRAYLTEDGRRLLEERIRELENTADDLYQAVDDPQRTEDIVLDYQRTTQEISRLRSVMESAGAIEDTPGNPHVVELGDTVTIRLGDGVEETHIIVHAVEAPLDDQRISVESPLAQALLGRRTGERVEVKAPSGVYECLILGASRRQLN